MRFLLSILFCLAGIAGAASPAQARESQTYKMMCRGGGKMQFSVLNDSRQQQVRFVLTFERAPQAANEQNPGQGQCAWADRAITVKEPTTIQVAEAPMCGFAIDLRAKADRRITLITSSSSPYQNGVTDALHVLLTPIFKGELFSLDVHKWGDVFHSHNYNYEYPSSLCPGWISAHP